MAIVLGAGREVTRVRPSSIAVRRPLRAVPYAAASAVVVVLMAPVLALVFGYRVFVVTSGSMTPLARTGDAIVLREVEGAGVRVGDVITFRPLREGGVRTHRVMGVHHLEGDGLHYRTKGDANDDFDPNLVPASHVLGRVAAVVPHIGREYLWATTPMGRLVLVGVPALLIIARELWGIARPRRLVRRRSVARSGFRARTATFAIASIAATGMAGPSAARFVDSAPAGANTFTSGQVNAPTNLNGSAQLVPCRVNLTWSAPASGLSPDGYDILRSNTSGGPYTLRKHVGAVTSASDDTGPLGALTTYYYVVRSTRSAWTSTNSGEKAVTTLLCAL